MEDGPRPFQPRILLERRHDIPGTVYPSHSPIPHKVQYLTSGLAQYLATGRRPAVSRQRHPDQPPVRRVDTSTAVLASVVVTSTPSGSRMAGAGRRPCRR